MKKRFTTLMTTLILSVFFTISASAYDVKVDGIYYNLAKNLAFVTSGDKKYEREIVIPESITVNEKSYTVKAIQENAFQYCIDLTSVTIPNSVTSIGMWAFSGCTGLTSITIPNSVTSIGNYAFSGCTGLTSITIPNSVTSIGNSAFSGCSGLTKEIIVNDMFVFLPTNFNGHYSVSENITKIIGGAFSGCEKLTSVTLPNSLLSIGEMAFEHCTKLTSISVPNTVTTIGVGAFFNCALEEINIPTSVTTIENGTFFMCSSLKSIDIHNKITKIGDNAFWTCTSLSSFNIPNSVTSVGEGAFYNCTNIKKMFIDCQLEIDVSSCTGLEELTIGENVNIVHSIFKMRSLRKVVLGKNVTQIRAEAFASSNIEEFTITGEEPPYLYPNVFGTKDLSNATLYVPDSKIEYYQTTEPWSKFGKILTLSGDSPSEPEKCAIPSISFSEGQLQFSCETEGAKCYYTLNNSDVKTVETLSESKIVNLSACYDITCYAKAEGYINSDVATAKLYWLPSSGTLEGDNINNVSMRGIAIQSAGGFINISGLDNNEKVDFYATDGKALGSAKSIDGSVSFSAKQGTVIVAKIGKESVKIAVE